MATISPTDWRSPWIHVCLGLLLSFFPFESSRNEVLATIIFLPRLVGALLLVAGFLRLVVVDRWAAWLAAAAGLLAIYQGEKVLGPFWDAPRPLGAALSVLGIVCLVYLFGGIAWLGMRIAERKGRSELRRDAIWLLGAGTAVLPAAFLAALAFDDRHISLGGGLAETLLALGFIAWMIVAIWLGLRTVLGCRDAMELDARRSADVPST